MPFLSVIIPVYNSEKYVGTCLKSLLEQTFDDFEAICINDGSTDSSLEILNTFKEKDARIKVFSKQNEGQGTARNFALEYAAGDFVLYLDSDDWLEKNALELLNKNLSSEVDILFFNNYNFFENTSSKYKNRYVDSYYCIFKDNIFTPLEAESVLFCTNGLPFKVYKREFLVKNEIKYSNTRFIEDSQFYIKALLLAKGLKCVDEYVVNYRIHGSSTTSNAYKYIDTIEKTYYSCEKIFEEFKFSNSKNLLDSFLYNRYCQLFYYFKNMPYCYKRRYYKMFQKVARHIYNKYSNSFLKKNIAVNFFMSVVNNCFEVHLIKRFLIFCRLFLFSYFEI